MTFPGGVFPYFVLHKTFLQYVLNNERTATKKVKKAPLNDIPVHYKWVEMRTDTNLKNKYFKILLQPQSNMFRLIHEEQVSYKIMNRKKAFQSEKGKRTVMVDMTERK